MPRIITMQVVSSGSSTLTTWKRRAKAGSFSKYFLYSLQVVAAMVRNSPRARAAPTWTIDRLNQYSAEPWPDFHVPPGNLTAHGRTLMTLLGTYYGDWLSRERLVRRGDCAFARRIYVWADTDQRTIETGRAVAETLLPGCPIAVHSEAERTSAAKNDPL